MHMFHTSFFFFFLIGHSFKRQSTRCDLLDQFVKSHSLRKLDTQSKH